jgi:hypothetical protein
MPLRATAPQDEEFASYLEWLASRLEVIVIDGSAPAVFAAHAHRWPANIVHAVPDPARRQANGKVWGVLTGLDLASHDRIVIADEDIRYDEGSLAGVVRLLDRAEVVRPQNYFDPLPWHAAWDSGRILFNRVTGGDWPGTLAFRRSYLPRGYDGNCLFENLELVRTIRAAGGREIVARSLFVRRLPPRARHFLSQRVRQAYDEWARPARLIGELLLLPSTIVLARRSPAVLGVLAAVAMAIGELGRRSGGATIVFPPASSFFVPLWLAERGICAWLAVASRLVLGGVRYHGQTIRRAASDERLPGLGGR